MHISKRDAFTMTPHQAEMGRRVWERTGVVGRLTKSSYNAEDMAPKTWIMYVNSKGEEIGTLECEIYSVGRYSDTREAVAMVHGMCPKCGEHWIAREDNKTMTVEYVTYRQASKHLRVNWDFHCRKVMGRRPSDSDKIPVVSSPERWACDYCRGWCVVVRDGIASDYKGVTQLIVPMGVPIVGKTSEKVSF